MKHPLNGYLRANKIHASQTKWTSKSVKFNHCNGFGKCTLQRFRVQKKTSTSWPWLITFSNRLNWPHIRMTLLLKSLNGSPKRSSHVITFQPVSNLTTAQNLCWSNTIFFCIIGIIQFFSRVGYLCTTGLVWSVNGTTGHYSVSSVYPTHDNFLVVLDSSMKSLGSTMQLCILLLPVWQFTWEDIASQTLFSWIRSEIV